MNIRDEILDLLLKLSSEEFQKEEWEYKKGKTYFFPEEILCQWFDDFLGGTDGYWEKNNIFSKSEVNLLLPVGSALRSFYKSYEKDRNLKLKDLLNYKPWDDVVKEAKKALKNIEYK